MAKDAVLIEMARFGVWGYKEQKWLAPHYAAWLIPAEGQGKISIVDLGEAANIDTAVQQARKALEKADKTIGNEGEADAEKQLRDAMRNLTRMVFEPLEAHFGNARQLIIRPERGLVAGSLGGVSSARRQVRHREIPNPLLHQRPRLGEPGDQARTENHGADPVCPIRITTWDPARRKRPRRPCCGA